MELDVPIVARNLSRIESGNRVLVSASTDSPGFFERGGTIQTVEWLDEDGDFPVKFSYKDRKSDSILEATIGRTTNESRFREQTDRQWIARGEPLQVIAYPNLTDWDDIQALAYKELMEKEDTTTIAAAEISSNRTVFSRGNWSDHLQNEKQTLSFN